MGECILARTSSGGGSGALIPSNLPLNYGNTYGESGTSMTKIAVGETATVKYNIKSNPNNYLSASKTPVFLTGIIAGEYTYEQKYCFTVSAAEETKVVFDDGVELTANIALDGGQWRVIATFYNGKSSQLAVNALSFDHIVSYR